MRSLFKNDDYEFFLTNVSSIFQCRRCHKQGNGKHVIRQDLKNKSKFSGSEAFHTDCAAPVIHDLRGNLKLEEVKTLDQVIKKKKIVTAKTPYPTKDMKKEKVKPKIFEGIDKPKEAEEKFELVDHRKKAKILLKNEKIYIKSPYDEKMIQRFNFLGDIKFNREFKLWECRIEVADYETCRAILNIYKKFDQYKWTIEKGAFEKIKERLDFHKKKLQENKELSKVKNAKDMDITFENLKLQPYGYQKVGINFLNQIDGIGYIGDEMGLGKTLQFIGYTSQFDDWKTVVVCPASLKYNWKNEIEKFTDKKVVIISEFKPDSLDPKKIEGDYFIINYEQLKKYETFLRKMKFNCVGLDEAQYIKTYSSARTKIVRKLFKKLPHKILMSGTPVKNRPIEFYSQLNFLRPDIFGKKNTFGLRYCDGKRGPFGIDFSGASNIDELKRKISPFYIRRIQEEVLPDLPEKTVSVLDIELSNNEKAEYNDMLDGLMGLDEVNRSLTGHLSRSSKKQQLIELEKLARYCAEKKVSRVIDFIKKNLEESDSKKIIVFSRWKVSQSLLEEEISKLGVGYTSIFGDDKDKKRQAAIDEFQDNDNCRIFIGSTEAAGVGITLTKGNVVIFNDFMWSPADHQQATKRAHRIGQKNPVFVYYMKFMNTIEDQVWAVIGKKLEVVTEVLKDDADNDLEKENLEKIYNKIVGT